MKCIQCNVNMRLKEKYIMNLGGRDHMFDKDADKYNVTFYLYECPRCKESYEYQETENGLEFSACQKFLNSKKQKSINKERK